MKKRTVPELFMIESLDWEDEDHERFEAGLISNIIGLIGKDPTRHYYIRTLRELEEIMKKFGESHYRYLHISCHGDSSGMATTLDFVKYPELGKIMRPNLDRRRVFVSACEMVNSSLAKELFKDSGILSLIGPREKINLANSAAFWVSFYQLIFKINSKMMTRKTLKGCIQGLCDLYCVKIDYFAKSSNAAGFTLFSFSPHKNVMK